MGCPFFQLDKDLQMEMFDMLDFADRCARRCRYFAAYFGTAALKSICPVLRLHVRAPTPRR